MEKQEFMEKAAKMMAMAAAAYLCPVKFADLVRIEAVPSKRTTDLGEFHDDPRPPVILSPAPRLLGLCGSW